jgi:hypothetical protein
MTWDANNYFSKCRVYWQRASSEERGSEQFFINVAFACEFLIRGGLCAINPALNSAIDEESLLHAAGITTSKTPRTLDIGKSIERLKRAIPTISDDVKNKIDILIAARNRELHSDTAEISLISSQELMPSVYSLFVIVTNYAKQDIKIIMGEADAEQAKQVAEAITKDRKKRIKDHISVWRDRFYSLPKDEQDNKRASVNTDRISAVLKSGHHLRTEKCPACAAKGSLIGVPVGRSAPLLKNNEIVQEVRVIPTKFECKCCGLEISGLDELMAADFSHEFCSMDNVDPIEHLNIDPYEYIDAEQVAREYYREMYEYQDE